ncbi:hypothetical protein NUW54_g13664 [Trametes sanguinea]|uniref:Uncharacterized protein n=1 Tax=Trametes sanguinea TaxID=158606 RepID=A0ACC1MKW3_9APHY|nr:hypothetical protein NUW54_g13664 [Trametes sanguinea]
MLAGPLLLLFVVYCTFSRAVHAFRHAVCRRQPHSGLPADASRLSHAPAARRRRRTAVTRHRHQNPANVSVATSSLSPPGNLLTRPLAGTHTAPVPKSSCTENTVLVGVNYLKGQPEVLAMPDEAYPPWLWTLLQPKEIPDDGPGGKGEKIRLRKANRQRIREQNFMKTQ